MWESVLESVIYHHMLKNILAAQWNVLCLKSFLIQIAVFSIYPHHFDFCGQDRKTVVHSCTGKLGIVDTCGRVCSNRKCKGGKFNLITSAVPILLIKSVHKH